MRGGLSVCLLFLILCGSRVARADITDLLNILRPVEAAPRTLSRSPPRKLLFKHVLRNALIPILTGVVVILPTLFIGNLIIEAFFGIPGLGSYTIEAIQSQDFAIVRAMVFLGSLLYIAGLILTDISYTLADPRVRLT